MDTKSEKLYADSKLDNNESDDEDYYQVKKAPMMLLLPGGSRPTAESSPVLPPKKISDAQSCSTKDGETEEESEYTYETEEEEDEELADQENGIQMLPADLESYEIKAERVLEEQRERVSIAPELDYIDEEDEDIPPAVSFNKHLPLITTQIRKVDCVPF